MKNHEILQKFSEYCIALNLTQDQSYDLPHGEKHLAVPGTVFLSHAPLTKHKTYAIMRNNDNGTATAIYGHTAGDKVYGYMEGVMASIPAAETVKTMGNIIRALDEDGKHCEYWLNDGDYVPAIEDVLTGVKPYIPPVDFYNSRFQSDIQENKFSQGSYDYEVHNTGDGMLPVRLTLYPTGQSEMENQYSYMTEAEALHDVNMCNAMEGGILLDPVK